MSKLQKSDHDVTRGYTELRRTVVVFMAALSCSFCEICWHMAGLSFFVVRMEHVVSSYAILVNVELLFQKKSTN